ncbi:DUF3868 domain-containing protein [Dysgonomonas sp. GY75]|uniref:DUF3868 domain-containing protein n=1 Tax=Dysgonomonas sp. GY75 TaxID=2780419 RepID=UPI0018838351|nr:DUF3868 domain-containing protein [Dysgonomonas sp. GY75]MBF0647209.1 DUF3868 domain-containing protein [Dysgonomonas sp. GY75]
MLLKNTRIISVCLFLFLFAGVQNIFGQSRLHNSIRIKKNELGKMGDKLVMDFDILIHNVHVSANNRLVLTPVIRDTIDGKQQFLPASLINGKTRDKLYKRGLILTGMEKDLSVHSVFRADKKDVDKVISYKTSITYEPWMKNASVYLSADLCGCDGSAKDYTEYLVANGITGPEKIVEPKGIKPDFGIYTPHVAFIAPPREEKKERSSAGEAYLIFGQGEWNISPDMYNNRSELAKIEQSLNYIREEPSARITKLHIKAYASVEGSYEMNLALSQKRAGSLLGYVDKVYTFPKETDVLSEGLGEDWTRLAELIEKDTKLDNKGQLLNIIHTVGIHEGREKKLMDMDEGRPYKYMLETLFPLLRRTDYKIEYNVPSFTIEKGKQLLNSKPGMLSLDEMFRIANTYEKGSAAFNNVFKTAAAIYPSDKTASINAASVLILEKDYKAAEELLEGYADEPAAWNNLGIVYMSGLRLGEAEKYLAKAKDMGVEEAVYNLGILEELKVAVQKYETQGPADPG